jgi:predicted nuclease of predicted toxin-antitoxin system
MVQIMAEHGLRGPDAMIVNLFDKSRFSLLITSDSDFENYFDDSMRIGQPKAIFLLQ